ncbi:uncharacterized protein JCM15063_000256 [Sporobolomyces koalae]|uniref:uncharacterized protein n=1 Tax=Sporobolomyces koalae TaxID=500713 RepID=UPI00316F555D
MASDWRYSTLAALDEIDTPSVRLSATCHVPRSLGTNCVYATSQLALDIRVRVDDVSVVPNGLPESALLRHVIAWLYQHKGKIGFDGIAQPQATAFVVLYVASRAARLHTLVIDSAATPTAALDSLELLLEVCSARTACYATAQSSLLESQIMAPLPQLLHFALASLVEDTFAGFAKALANSFPLCFNPLWVERLTHDLAAHQSIARTLARILDPAKLVRAGQFNIDDLSDSQSSSQELVPLFASSSTTPTLSDCTRTLQCSPRGAIEKGLLLIAKQHHLIDPIVFETRARKPTNVDPASQSLFHKPNSNKANGSRRGREGKRDCEGTLTSYDSHHARGKRHNPRYTSPGGSHRERRSKRERRNTRKKIEGDELELELEVQNELEQEALSTQSDAFQQNLTLDPFEWIDYREEGSVDWQSALNGDEDAEILNEILDGDGDTVLEFDEMF